MRDKGRLPTVPTSAPFVIKAGPRTSDSIGAMINLGCIAGPFNQNPLPGEPIKVNGIMDCPTDLCIRFYNSTAN